MGLLRRRKCFRWALVRRAAKRRAGRRPLFAAKDVEYSRETPYTNTSRILLRRGFCGKGRAKTCWCITRTILATFVLRKDLDPLEQPGGCVYFTTTDQRPGG